MNVKNQYFIKPAFENCDKCIILSTDNGFAPATAVAIQSLIQTASKDNYYDIVILHSRVSPLMQKVITSMNNSENISIRFFDISETVGSMHMYTENRKTITMEAYYRLFAPWLLSEEYKYAFYIDGDMIATRDIYPIFDIDLGNNYIAAVKDYWGICNCYMEGDPRREYQKSIGIKNVDNYIISATLLFNLKKFREESSLSDILHICTKEEWLQHDQDVVNILCQDYIHYLTADWGYVSDYGNNRYLPEYLQTELANANDPILIHFANVRKPWVKTYTEGHLEFWKYAQNTPFFAFLINKIESDEYKSFVLNELSGGKFDCEFTDEDIIRYYKNIALPEYSKGPAVYHRIEIGSDTLHLEGLVGFYATPMDTPVEVFLKINGVMIPADKQYTDNSYRKKEDIYTCRGELFELDYKLDPMVKEYDVVLVCKVNGYTIEKKDVYFGSYAPICRRYENSYYYNNGWAVKTDNTTLDVFKADAKMAKKCERQFLHELLMHGGQAERHAVLLRPFVRFVKKHLKKPVWMVSDRVMKADDNGEVFFKFLAEKKKREVTPVFVISKKSPDYLRLKKIGKVVSPYSISHRIYHLIASFTISSQTDLVFRNPMRRSKRPYSDILSQVKYVFLQHGVIHNDISGWLCKKRQACVGFVSTTQREHDSLIGGNYHYDASEIWLTGMPRFDRLKDEREKLITVLPTWRRYLTKRQNPATGIWELVADFANTDYATFYRTLMNSERLNSAAREYGYKIQFKIHPSFLTHEEEFGFNDSVNILDINEPYRKIYSKSSLVVTDYSSAIYDFIFLRKPMIYCQFDREDFFKKHMTENVELDYENEGYGEIVTDVESAIDLLIDYMKNDCLLKDKYRERIDNVFVYNDKNNCQRVYERIIETDKK